MLSPVVLLVILVCAGDDLYSDASLTCVRGYRQQVAVMLLRKSKLKPSTRRAERELLNGLESLESAIARVRYQRLEKQATK